MFTVPWNVWNNEFQENFNFVFIKSKPVKNEWWFERQISYLNISRSHFKRYHNTLLILWWICQKFWWLNFHFWNWAFVFDIVDIFILLANTENTNFTHVVNEKKIFHTSNSRWKKPIYWMFWTTGWFSMIKMNFSAWFLIFESE